MPSSLPTSDTIGSWHAHVYFDVDSRAQAWGLRERVDQALAGRVEIGRFHERPVGPHPMWSFQLAFGPAALAEVVSYLVLHHGDLDVLVHPNTGDDLRDHRDRAMWIGASHALDLAGLNRPV